MRNTKLIQQQISVTTGLKKIEELVQNLHKSNGAWGRHKKMIPGVPLPVKMQELVQNVCSPCMRVVGVCARKNSGTGLRPFSFPPGWSDVFQKNELEEKKKGPGCY